MAIIKEKDIVAQEQIDASTLREQHKTSDAVFSGVCAAQKWKPGKCITEEVFLAAVKKFLSKQMGKAE